MNAKTKSLVEDAFDLHMRDLDIPGVFLGAVERGDATYVTIAGEGSVSVYSHRDGAWLRTVYSHPVLMSVPSSVEDQEEEGHQPSSGEPPSTLPPHQESRTRQETPILAIA